MSLVRDIVQERELFCVEEDQTVAEVARRMADLHVGAILVLKKDELRGLFSERDLMKRVVLERLDPERTPVSAVMSRDLVTVDELASVEDAMHKLQYDLFYIKNLSLSLDILIVFTTIKTVLLRRGAA